MRCGDGGAISGLQATDLFSLDQMRISERDSVLCILHLRSVALRVGNAAVKVHCRLAKVPPLIQWNLN